MIFIKERIYWFLSTMNRFVFASEVDDTIERIDNVFTNGLFWFIVLVIVVSIIAYLLIRLVNRVASRRASGNLKIFYNIFKIVILGIAITIILSGIRPLHRFGAALLTGSGIIAAVAGFAAQYSLRNLFSGVSISLNRPFLVGQFVEVLSAKGSIQGIVKTIGLRHTILIDVTNKRVVIPNSILDQEVVRTSRINNKKGVVNYLTIKVDIDNDIHKVMSLIESICDAHPNVLDTRSGEQKQINSAKTKVHVIESDVAMLTIQASVWTKDVIIGRDVLSDLRRDIATQFKEQQVSMPSIWNLMELQEGQANNNG